MENKEILIYKDESGNPLVNVHLDKESVWLTVHEMALLFDKDDFTISRHINNVYNERELSKDSTTWKSEVVRLEGERRVKREMYRYNLDVIISVGYRVKSKRGTEFRIWATNILKEHLLRGYSLNQRKLKDLGVNIDIIKRMIGKTSLKTDEKNELLDLVLNYTKSWVLLNQFDEGKIAKSKGTKDSKYVLTYDEAKEVISDLRESNFKKGIASDLFGNEIDSGLKKVVGSIYQTFDSKDLYPSVEEKAAHLLYFVIKDHPFSDGNKRIGSLLFIYLLTKHKLLLKGSGEKKINDNALVLLALLIAESNPKEKENMVNLVTNLLSD